MIEGFKVDQRVEGDALATVRNSGAGFLSDLAKMAERDGIAFGLTGAEARDSGAGFVQDVLKEIEGPLPPNPDDAPTLAGVDPASGPYGGSDITVTITGTKFSDATVMLWNGVEDNATFVDETTMTTTVKLSMASVASSCTIQMKDGELLSNIITFEITEPEPEPEEAKRKGKFQHGHRT
jgi:IPT/TIG domain